MLDHNSFDFSGKTVLVTGAASGIGAAVARAFADHGASLKLADRNAGGLSEVAATLPSDRVDQFVYDQRRAEDIQRLAAWACGVDILFNNAGILGTGPSESLSDEAIQAIIETNLTGPILLANAIGLSMLARGKGVIINTTSQLAFCGAPERAAYSSAKAGLAQFTRAVAAEWGPRGVRVAAIAPGRTLTPLNADKFADPVAKAKALEAIPLGRLGETEEIANLVLVLASDVASYVAGHSLIADGGYVVAT
jgi:NAD(P)-dependent dehydrogenase (short-subunit alcohol dehydrogenase family)